jgi:hypothetical protein
MIVIARLGGYLHRKSDGPPGFECLGNGYVIFDAKVQMMQLRQTSASKPRRRMRRRKSVGHAQG